MRLGEREEESWCFVWLCFGQSTIACYQCFSGVRLARNAVVIAVCLIGAIDFEQRKQRSSSSRVLHKLLCVRRKIDRDQSSVVMKGGRFAVLLSSKSAPHAKKA